MKTKICEHNLNINVCSICQSGEARSRAPVGGSEVELMLWLASNMDCLSLCCVCCEGKRKELMDYFKKHGVADSHLLEDLRNSVPND